MDTIDIRRVSHSDIDQLQKIGRQTFSETFSAGNTEENMREYLKDGFSIEKLIAELHDENSEFYFATMENQVVGYFQLAQQHL